MSTVSPQPDAAALEQLIFQVRGIQAARVVTNPAGLIDEVHVVGLPGRSAKQIVRDIESILYVRGGVRVDHRKVSLVQLDDAAARQRGPRLLLLEAAYRQAGDVPEVVVTLGLRERQARGVCAGAVPDGADALLLTAQATVRAIVDLVGAVAGLRVEQVALQPFGALQVCLSHLSLTTEAGLETLLGISMVRDDLPAAAARAVLDAVNRPLLRILADQA